MTEPAFEDVEFHINGTPAPQGSKRHVGRGVLVESSKRVKPWRAAVAAAASAQGVRLAGPVFVRLSFYLPRPAGHYGTGRNAHKVKASAPMWPTSRAHGDLDKLVRSTLDGLVAGGLLAEDDFVVELTASKRYARHPENVGVTVQASTYTYPERNCRA